MHKLALIAFLLSNTAIAHEGHGASFGHLHWLEYGLIAAAIVVAVISVARRKP